MSLESLFQHIIFSEHLAEENRRLMRQGRALAGASGLGAGGLEAEGIRRQWAEPGGGGRRLSTWREGQLKGVLSQAPETGTLERWTCFSI